MLGLQRERSITGRSVVRAVSQYGLRVGAEEQRQVQAVTPDPEAAQVAWCIVDAFTREHPDQLTADLAIRVGRVMAHAVAMHKAGATDWNAPAEQQTTSSCETSG